MPNLIGFRGEQVGVLLDLLWIELAPPSTDVFIIIMFGHFLEVKEHLAPLPGAWLPGAARVGSREQ